MIDSAALRARLVPTAILVMLSAFACKHNHPPSTPEVSGHRVWRTGDTATLSAVSTDQDDDLISYLFAWGDTSSANWSADYPSGTGVSREHVFAESGAYAVRARAKDDKDAESDWSATETLLVGNFPPSTPSRPAGPTACDLGMPYACSTAAVSPYGESLFIQFDWDESLSEWGGRVASGSFRAGAHTFSYAGIHAVRARSMDQIGDTSSWSDSLTVVVGDSSNLPPSISQPPTGPDHGYPAEPYTYAVIPTDPNGDDVAVRFDWGDSTVSDWTAYSASGLEARLDHAWADTGAFQVTAQARDRALAESEWSTPLTVQVLPRPETPAVPIGPTLCFRDTTYAFKSVTTDRFGDSVSIRFYWGQDTSDWSPFVASGETVSASYAWTAVGHYEITAQARDHRSHLTAWSDDLPIEVAEGLGPNTPFAPDGPFRGGQDSFYTFTAYATHPQDLPVAIRFDWGDGDTSAWGTYKPSGETTTMGHAWSVPDTYDVRAQARDTGNATSEWSAPRTIVIRPIDTLQIWRIQIKEGAPENNYSSPAIAADGTIYVGSQDNYVYAVNSNGTLKWRFRTGDVVRSSPAIAADGTIYVGSYDNRLYALNPDGSAKWSYLTGGNISSSPALAADGTIIFGSSDKKIYALNPDSTLQWSYTTAGEVYSSPAVAADGTIYCGSKDDYLYALTDDGQLEWRFSAGRDIISAPAIGTDGTIYFGSLDGYLYAVNPDSTLKWSVLTSGQVQSSPAIAPDGTIYFGSEDNCLYAINPAGSIEWRCETGDNVNSSPAINANGTVYFGSDDNNLYALNPDSTLLWWYPTDNDIESSPTIGPNGRIYFVGNDGYLYSLKGTSALANSSWPKFRHDIRNSGRAGGP